MIFLAFIAAIFHEIAGTLLQFDVINFRFATRCTTRVHFFTFCFIAHDNNFEPPPEEGCFPQPLLTE
jgi:hypothetical protein